MGLEVRKMLEHPILFITVMPTQPAESLQEGAGVAAFEEEKINAEVYPYIDGGSPYQEVSLIRGTTAFSGVETGVRGDAEALACKHQSQTLD